jgi:LacI family transcriptional regulator
VTTIRDVAKLAGVGVGTASRALSGRGAVSSAALAKVQFAAESLNFRPSAIAQALSLQRSGSLGVYVPELASYFYSSIVTAADQLLRAHGRHLVVVCGSPSRDPRQEALDGVAFLLSRDCDGLLLTGNDLTDADLREISQRVAHLAVINRKVPGMAGRCFIPDHEEGGRIAARALLSQGHRHLAVLTGPASVLDNRLRMKGFLGELALHGVAPSVVFNGDFSRECGWETGAKLARSVGPDGPLNQRCSAVFCANDRMAMGLISRLWVEGWRVPDDISVVGYDNDDFASFATPPLTTVHMPLIEQARLATAQIMRQCYGDPCEPEAPCPPALALRLSVAKGPFEPLGAAPLINEHADASAAAIYPPPRAS